MSSLCARKAAPQGYYWLKAQALPTLRELTKHKTENTQPTILPFDNLLKFRKYPFSKYSVILLRDFFQLSVSGHFWDDFLSLNRGDTGDQSIKNFGVRKEYL